MEVVGHNYTVSPDPHQAGVRRREARDAGDRPVGIVDRSVDLEGGVDSLVMLIGEGVLVPRFSACPKVK